MESHEYGLTRADLDSAVCPEFDLLLSWAGSAGEGNRKTRPVSSPPSNLDWRLLVEMAGLHGLTGLLHTHLEGQPSGSAPANARSRLASRFYSTVASNLVYSRQLLNTVAALEAAGVEAVAFKGPALAVQAYRHLGLREFSDLDIVVRRADLARAAAVLEALDFRATDRETVLERAFPALQNHYLFLPPESDRAPIELHCEAIPWRYVAPFDTDRLLRRSQSVALSGGVVRSFSPEDLVLVLATHGAKHGWRRLAWVFDVAGLIARNPNLDWDAVLAQARDLGLRRTLSVALRLVSDLVGDRLPAEVDALGGRDPVVAKLVRRLRPRLFSRPYLSQPCGARWHHLIIRERWADRFRFVARCWV